MKARAGGTGAKSRRRRDQVNSKSGGRGQEVFNSKVAVIKSRDINGDRRGQTIREAGRKITRIGLSRMVSTDCLKRTEVNTS